MPLDCWDDDVESELQRLIPDYMQAGIRRYICDGILPGKFLTAVLENNLKEAVARADLTNMEILHRYVAFLYNQAPSTCWGSPEKVTAWVAQHETILKKY